MELCLLESRYGEAIGSIVAGEGSVFKRLGRIRLPEQDWFGALHYMELIDCTEGGRNKMHAVFAPGVPRTGEILTPQRGSTMEVIGIDHLVVSQSNREGLSAHTLIPHVLLQAIDNEYVEPDDEE